MGQGLPQPEAETLADRFFDFWRVDVFTDTPLTGNPLAVFPRALGLSDSEMLGVAREMNLSETTFVLPPRSPSAHYRNRIFTPAREIPFAGHPSLGTAYVAAMEGLVPHPEGSSVLYQEVEIGVLPLEIRVEGGQVRKVIMTQGEPSLGPRLTSYVNLAKALGVTVRDIAATRLRPQIASSGLPSLIVPLRSLDVVRKLDPDLKALKKILDRYGPHTTCYAFAFGAERPEAALHARSFSPGDLIREDPATGSAAGACGVYLAANGRLPGATFAIEQGIEIKHASRIEVTVEAEGRKVRGVKVGGQVTPIIRGSLRLP